MLQAALNYADLGYAVFPCAPGGKRPLTANGLLDATTDGERIEAWWTKHPDANIAIATQGLLVVDIDPDPAGNPNPWLADQPDKLMELAKAPFQVTPRGGKHYIFRQPAPGGFRSNASKIAPQVDHRADGGYIVASPSKNDSHGEYKWINPLDVPPSQLPEPPVWLLKLLYSVGTSISAARTEQQQPSNAIPAGQRNAALTSMAGTMRRVGMSQSEIVAALKTANAERCKPPMDDSEIETIAWSVARYEPDGIAVAVTEQFAAQDEEEGEEVRAKNPGKFPRHLLSVPGFIGDVMDYTLATAHRPQPEMALAAGLCLMSVLTGRKVSDVFNSRTNIFALAVCPSGGGKDHPRDVNKRILFEAGLGHLVGPESAASHAGLLSAIEHQPTLLLQWDEIGRLLRVMADAKGSPHLFQLGSVLLKLYTSSHSIYLGDAYSDRDKNRTINQPHAVLFGTSGPQALFESLTTESLTDGFLARFMIFEASNRLPRLQSVPTRDVPKSIVEVARYWGDFMPGGNLGGENPSPAIVPYTSAALQIMDQLEEVAYRAASSTDETITTLWTRATQRARKLALLYACSESHLTPAVDVAAAKWACELVDYGTRKMLFDANQWITSSHFEARRQKVARLIASMPDGITTTQLARRQRSLTSRELREVLEALQHAGEVEVATTETGGRPRTIYRSTNVNGLLA